MVAKIPLNREIFNVLKQYCEAASEKTVKQYCLRIQSIQKDIDGASFYETNKVKEYLKNKDIGKFTLINYLSSIVTYLLAINADKTIVHIYAKERDIVNEKETKKDNKNKIDKNYLNNFINHIKSKLPCHILTYEDKVKFQQYICVALHQKFKLSNELCDTVIYKINEFKKLDKIPTNYVLINAHNRTAFLHMKDRKINERLDGKIAWYIIRLYECGNKYLVYDVNGNKINHCRYTKFLNKTFAMTGKTIGSRLLNKLF